MGHYGYFALGRAIEHELQQATSLKYIWDWMAHIMRYDRHVTLGGIVGAWIVASHLLGGMWEYLGQSP